ncbi:MAG: hypothetical protein Q4G09_05135, partial [Clostridia bacterium]|nr:hypothetical protein [Clostridia bacterium]
LLINIIFLPFSYATDRISADDIFKAGDDFLSVGKDTSEAINTEALDNTSSTIFNILLAIAICVSVIIGAVLGFQFILGSVEAKAKVSEALVLYIVGCCIIFGAFTIWKAVVTIGNDVIVERQSSTVDKSSSDNEQSGTHKSSSGATHGGSSGKF